MTVTFDLHSEGVDLNLHILLFFCPLYINILLKTPKKVMCIFVCTIAYDNIEY